jgi:hypothetical protein
MSQPQEKDMTASVTIRDSDLKQAIKGSRWKTFKIRHTVYFEVVTSYSHPQVVSTRKNIMAAHNDSLFFPARAQLLADCSETYNIPWTKTYD